MSDRSLLERETIILFNDAEGTANIGTTSPRVYKQLVRRLGPPTRVLSPGSWSWDIAKEQVALPRKKSKRAPMTAEHKLRLAEARNRNKDG